jgi:hypothetical protein
VLHLALALPARVIGATERSGTTERILTRSTTTNLNWRPAAPAAAILPRRQSGTDLFIREIGFSLAETAISFSANGNPNGT